MHEFTYDVPYKLLPELRRGWHFRELVIPTGFGGQSHKLTNAVVKNWSFGANALKVTIQYSRGETGRSSPSGFLSGGVLSRLTPGAGLDGNLTRWPDKSVFCDETVGPSMFDVCPGSRAC